MGAVMRRLEEDNVHELTELAYRSAVLDGDGDVWQKRRDSNDPEDDCWLMAGNDSENTTSEYLLTYQPLTLIYQPGDEPGQVDVLQGPSGAEEAPRAELEAVKQVVQRYYDRWKEYGSSSSLCEYIGAGLYLDFDVRSHQ